jgi:AcrR family transcriptional regulator
MSLYHHVANKDEILNGIVEIAVEQFELPADSADWKTSIRRSAISAHETFRRHRWACRLILTTEPTSSRPARFRYMNALLGCLRNAGFSPGLTYHGYHAIYSHTMGFTLWEGTFPKDIDLAEIARTFLRDFPLDDYPHLAEHVEQHLAGSSPDDVGEFEFVLDLILDGLERARDAQAAT